MYAPFNDSLFESFIERPKFSNNSQKSINDDFLGHVYCFASTIPQDYLYWFSPPPKNTLTVTGESKSQVLIQFREALSKSKLELASTLAVELHCSGYFNQAFNVIIEIVGTHIHIHNPNIASHIMERYNKFSKQMGLPSKCGTIHFPEDKDFFNKPEVLAYRSTINCQTVRNFIIEIVSLICLSHQKEMSLPRIQVTDVTEDRLCKSAKSIHIKNPDKMMEKNELHLILKIIEKYLLNKNPKVEDVIYWILWLLKFESKCKRKGESLPCKAIKIEKVPPSECDHWVWYIWKILFSRLGYYPDFKKIQILNVYYLFRIDFTKKIVVCRLPLLFFAMRLLKYDVSNNFPSVINHLHLYVQACANINALYKNLQIRLARKSWVDVLGCEETENKAKPKLKTDIKPPKKMTKKEKEEQNIKDIENKTSYLDILPRAQINFE